MAKNVRIKDIDKGYKKIEQDLRRISKKPYVDVGVIGNKGAAVHKGTKATNAEIASWMEFGTETVPARSFIRGTIDARANEIYRLIKKLLRDSVLGKRPALDGLKILGLSVVGMIQQFISDGIDPPNSPATIKAKGSSTPLIDTGQMRQSINSEVHES
jgi:hypothetical protein